MIPIRDTLPAFRVAWLTRLLLLANVAAFAWELAQGPALESAVYRLAVVPAHWALGSPDDLLAWPGLFLTLITSQFLHGDFFHLGSNMLYLWIFADNVEDRLGHARFLALYLLSGVAAAVLQILVTPASRVPMVGASGAIAGVLGAYLLMFPGAKIVTLVPVGFFLQTMELPAVGFLGFWFLLQWVSGVASIGQVADVGGVAFWAHIGGFLSGMVWAVAFRPSRHR